MQNRKNARSLVFSYLAHFYDSWDVHNLNFLLNDVNCKINGGVMTKWIFRATTETPTKKNRVAVLPHLPTYNQSSRGIVAQLKRIEQYGQQSTLTQNT